MNKETTYRLNYLELAISVFWESEIPYEVSSVILLLLSGLQTKKINSLVFFLFLFFLSFLFFSQNPNGTWQDGGLQYIPGGARGKIQRGGGHDDLHVHGIMKVTPIRRTIFTFLFFLSFFINLFNSECMHFLVSWYTALFIRPSNCEKISPFVRCLAMNNYDSFTWTVDTPPSMLQG